jgi:hypothetical protein
LHAVGIKPNSLPSGAVKVPLIVIEFTALKYLTSVLLNEMESAPFPKVISDLTEKT